MPRAGLRWRGRQEETQSSRRSELLPWRNFLPVCRFSLLGGDSRYEILYNIYIFATIYCLLPLALGIEAGLLCCYQVEPLSREREQNYVPITKRFNFHIEKVFTLVHDFSISRKKNCRQNIYNNFFFNFFFTHRAEVVFREILRHAPHASRLYYSSSMSTSSRPRKTAFKRDLARKKWRKCERGELNLHDFSTFDGWWERGGGLPPSHMFVMRRWGSERDRCRGKL